MNSTDEDNRLAYKYYACLGYKSCPHKKGSNNQLYYLEWETELNCPQVFEQSYLIGTCEHIEWPPPKNIPLKIKETLLLHGRITELPLYYFVEKSNGVPTPTIWRKDEVESYKRRARNKEPLGWYPYENHHIYSTLEKFNLTGKVGMVIGSQYPWLESILLEVGKASKIVTVEYYPTISEHPQIDTLHPNKLSENYDAIKEKYKFGFIFSFSSLEHSGLGRYGDPIDPYGDFREMQKSFCLLDDGALVFLGVPLGDDSINYNAHRIYGKWRLSLMGTHFEFLGIDGNTNEKYFWSHVTGSSKQAVAVFRKRQSPIC